MMGRGLFRFGCLALVLACGGLTRSPGVAAEERGASGSSRVAPAAHGTPIPIPADALPAVQALDISQGPMLAPPANERVAIEPPATRRGAGSPSTGAPANPTPTPAADRSARAGTQPRQDTAGERFTPKWLSPSAAIEEAFGVASPPAGEAKAPAPAAKPQPGPAVIAMPQLIPPQSGSAKQEESPAPFEADEDIRPLDEGEKEPVRQPSAKVESRQGEPQQGEPRPNVAAPVEPKTVAQPLRPLTRNELLLRNKMRKVLGYYYRQPLNSAQHDTWEVMHSVLAYGLDSQIRQGGPRGESITAIGWLCYNKPCKNKQLLRINEEGEVRALYGVGLQGHMGQFLAMLAQSNVDRNYPIVVDGKNFTIQDLIAAEQKTCYADTELTFKLISLMHYLPSDTTWLNDRGETWSIERLIEEELKQPIRGAACGGTHRLAGLSLAARKRQLRGEPVTGVWGQAAEFTESYEQYAFRLQNSDGSFSTQWFKGSGSERDIDRRIKTSGHILEWLIYQSTDEELDGSRMVRGVNYVTNLLYGNSDHEWEIGPQCHALHALQLYNQRKFVPYDNAQMADRSEPSRSAQQPPAASRTRSTRGR